MPIFKCFFKIAWVHRVSIFVYMGIFAVLSFMISTIYASEEAKAVNDISSHDTSIAIAVIDRDGSELSKALTAYLNEKHELVDAVDNTEKLQDALFYRDVEYILFISDGFEKNIVNSSNNSLLENVKLPNSVSGIYIDNQIERYVSTVKAYLNAGYDIPDIIALTETDLHLSTTIETYTEQSDIPAESGYYFQYLAYILMAVIISALGPVLIAFNGKDLAKRIESSSLTLRERNIQIALGCLFLSLFIWIIFIIIAILIYGNEVFSVVGALRILNIFAYLAVSVGIAFLLGQFMKTTSALGAVNNAVSLGMSFLCGIFVQQNLLGPGVLSIAKFFPAYWYIRSNDILLYVTELNTVNRKIFTEGLVIQIGFAAAIFAVALVISRQKKINSVLS